MPKRENPTEDYNRMMDEAGLTGALLQTKGPFIKGVLDARQRLLAKLLAREAARDAAREGSVAVPINITNKKE